MIRRPAAERLAQFVGRSLDPVIWSSGSSGAPFSFITRRPPARIPRCGLDQRVAEGWRGSISHFAYVLPQGYIFRDDNLVIMPSTELNGVKSGHDAEDFSSRRPNFGGSAFVSRLGGRCSSQGAVPLAQSGVLLDRVLRRRRECRLRVEPRRRPASMRRTGGSVPEAHSLQ
jgi:hypothetical protein